MPLGVERIKVLFILQPIQITQKKADNIQFYSHSIFEFCENEILKKWGREKKIMNQYITH
ncbi:MAG: hypothetical protein AVDCRST_MAG96-3763 [uncultured Segetibacter sp.]|uniref:Uncharacterized protein n=1 Tax=uncultured Segetibacter sp. TaxID=481133 RepID=A0A6J4TWX5_9BACT|nr:MAG: hypothetical protein AVDCRST_MAG96-3763 [uncultured Segetibacter sp.]